MPEASILCSGLVDRIGLENATFTFKTDKTTISITRPIANHKVGLELVAQHLLDTSTGIISATDAISIVGHRVVQGGAYFSETTQITAATKEKIKALFSLAPLHNPANLEGIEVAETIFPKAKQVAVFDTAFHQSIPEHAYKYAIPNEFADTHNIRLYGFHGTSHKYVSEQAIAFLKTKKSNIISIHLGNGCSITAIKDGKSIDHSMGLTPLDGLIMGTRSGAIDPSVIFHLATTLNYSLDEINNLLQKKSGLLGLTGHSDLRDIQAEAKKGNKACQLALEMSAYRIKKYIGSYAAVLNGLDAIVFTAGIGENSPIMRELICKDLNYLGIALDLDKNQVRSNTLTKINTKDSNVKLLIIPTNEELEIATQALELFQN